jgi:enterochelin esterase-like enzyme
MSRLRSRRLLAGAAALSVILTGLLGAYSYVRAYSQHRGFVSIARLPRAGRGRLLNVNFYSRALHRRAFYLAYLPPGYNPSRRYPVFYLLHGMPGRPQVFIDIANMDVRLDNQLSQGHLQPMILVFPDGRIGGSTYSDSEWANTPAGQYESYVLDVVGDVDHRFATMAHRKDRVIAGFSAGAYGAINISLHHRSTFASVEAWSGYFMQTPSGVFAHAATRVLDYNSPFVYAAKLGTTVAADRLRVFMFVGRGDEASRQIVPMANALRRTGVSVSFAIYRGGHDWGVWYPRLNQMLILASRDVHEPMRAITVRAIGRLKAGRKHRRRHGAAGARRRLAGHERSLAPVRPTYVKAIAAPVRRQHSWLIFGLLLALVSAAAINLGFLLQHRGLTTHPGVGRRARLAVVRSRAWLAGQALGWVGFAAQIIAVTIAPLSLVQAFAAGGLAISVPLAAGIFRHRVSRRQLLAVGVVAASLASLPIALSSDHGHLRAGGLIGSSLIALAAAVALGLNGRGWARALAAGAFYGVADAGIKAVSVNWHAHDGSALISGWTVLALLATFCGFLSFQAALRDGNAVSAISLMTALTALAALAFGLLAFGESLGSTPTAVLVHLLSILLVLACVPVLAVAQSQIAGSERRHSHAAPRDPAATARRAVAAAAGVAAGAPVLLLSLLAGAGLLYALRGLYWFTAGPQVRDSLPLLQLAGFDAQPLARLAVAWLTAGVALGLILIRVGPLPRALAAGLLGGLLVLFASDAAFALTRNLPLGTVLSDRTPGLGAWLEALLFAAGSALPGSLGRLRQVLEREREPEPEPERRPPTPQCA